MLQHTTIPAFSDPGGGTYRNDDLCGALFRALAAADTLGGVNGSKIILDRNGALRALLCADAAAQAPGGANLLHGRAPLMAGAADRVGLPHGNQGDKILRAGRRAQAAAQAPVLQDHCHAVSYLDGIMGTGRRAGAKAQAAAGAGSCRYT